MAMIAERPELAEPVIEGLPYLGAEVVFAARSEMAVSLLDVLTRRTRAHLQDARATARGASTVAALLQGELGWSDEQCAREVAAYVTLAREEFLAAGLSWRRTCDRTHDAH
jgi:glycerol-3-phosphate dehydrogenase